MLINNKIPFVDENETMKNALITLNKKKLGFLVLINKIGHTSGVFTDGDLKRLLQKKKKIDNLKIKKFMSKKPFSVEENILASEVLTLMRKKRITNVCVFKRGNRKKTVGIIHIHSLLK